MKQTKHWLTTIAVLLCSLAASAHDFEAGGIYYNITSSTDLTVAVTYRGSSYNSYSDEYSGIITIPSTVTYNNETYSVTSISGETFRDCSSLTAITIPESVTKIGGYAFYYCSNLKAITIPESVTSIGSGAFYNCRNLSTITIPKSVTSIGKSAFLGCAGELIVNCNIPSASSNTDATFYYSNFTKITIGESVTNIGDYAFFYCSSLTEINIPENSQLTNIGDRAFIGCSSLTNITIPESVTSIGDQVFYDCSSLTNIVVVAGNAIYDSRNDCNAIIETSSNCLILGCSTTIIPESVTSIGNYAFQNCTNITNITIPKGVTSIGIATFGNCSNLTNIIIPPSVTSIGKQAFFHVPIKEVVFEDGNSNLLLGNNKYSDGVGGGLFEDCPVKKVYIGRNLTFSNANSSYNKSRTNALFARWWANSYSQLETAIIGPEVTSLPQYLFEDCKDLRTVISCIPAESLCPFDKTADGFLPSEATLYVPMSSKEIYSATKDWESFGTICEFVESDGLLYRIISEEEALVEVVSGIRTKSSITIPKQIAISGKKYSVSSIGSKAFCNNLGLTSVVIPRSVTSIGDRAFYNCSELTSIDFPDEVTHIGDEAFDNTPWEENLPDGLIYIGKVLYKYIGVMPANTSIVVKDETTGIGSNAFSYCDGLIDIAIPTSVTHIGSEAFFYCSGLTDITIPYSVTSIGNGAFDYCNNLTAVHISDIAAWCNIEFGNLSSNPLGNATNLYLNGELVTTIDIPQGVQNIKNYTFCFCNNLKSVTIPSSVTSIGDDAFYCCDSLTNIAIPSSVKSIGNSAFKYCESLTNVTIPSNVTSIGDEAFYGCEGLTAVHISDIAAWCNIKFEDYYSNPLYSANNLYLNEELITKLVIPDSVIEIKQYAFYGYEKLTSAIIGKGITNIGKEAFRHCDNLRTIINFSSITFNIYSSSHGYIAYNAYDITNAPNGVVIEDFIFGVIDGKYTLIRYLGNATQIILPTEINGETYTIGAEAFCYNTTISSIVIPAGVVNIESDAFYGCTNLKKIVNLSNLTITKGSTNNGYVAYYATDIITVPNGDLVGDFIFKTIDGKHTLVKCLLPSNNIIKDFGDLTLTDGSYNTYEFEVEEGDILSFDFSSYFFSIEITNTNTYETEHFYGEYGMEKYTHRFSTSGTYTFTIYNQSYSSLELKNLAITRPKYYKLVLPSNYKNNTYVIDNGVFDGYANITSITIPKGVAAIGAYAFNCSNLQNIYIEAVEPIEISHKTFSYGVYEYTTLYVPLGSKATYKAANYWKNFYRIEEYAIPGDINRDGIINVADLTDLLTTIKSNEGVMLPSFEDWISTNAGNSSSTSSHTYTIEANEGQELTFDWMVSSESYCDEFIVTLDGDIILRKSGEEIGSYNHTFTTTGTHTLVAEYTKDGSVNNGKDCGRIYNIKLDRATFSSEDINRDGMISIDDAEVIVSMILDSDTPSTDTSKDPTSSANATSSVTADINGESLLINITNPTYEFSAIQFDLILPHGIEVITESDSMLNIQLGSRCDSQSHSSLKYNLLANGSLRTIIYSEDNEYFNGTMGDIARLHISTNNLADGIYPFEIKNVTISRPCTREILADYKGYIKIVNSTITRIKNPELPIHNSEVLYDLQGRRVLNTDNLKGIYIINGKKTIK